MTDAGDTLFASAMDELGGTLSTANRQEAALPAKQTGNVDCTDLRLPLVAKTKILLGNKIC